MWHARFSLNETLIALVLDHLKTQRPAALNFASPALAKNPSKLCIPVPTPTNGAKRVTVIDRIEIGRREDRRVLMEYCYQLADLLLDFTPNSAGTTGVVFKASLHAGFGVPDPMPDDYLLLPGFPGPTVDLTMPHLPLQCTKVSIEARGNARWVNRANRWFLLFSFDTLTITDATGFPSLIGLVKGFVLPKLNLDVLAGAAMQLAPIQFKTPQGTATVSIPLVADLQTPNLFANNTLTASVKLA